VPLRCDLGIHEDSDIAAAKRFWKQELGVEVASVTVAVSRASKRMRHTLPHGTLRVVARRGSVEWLTKMLVWLERVQEL
jgi:hypothetical protein